MLLKAAVNFHIDMESSWMVGDSENDVKAGKAAGCKTALIGEGSYGQDLTVHSLREFVSVLASRGVLEPQKEGNER